MPHLQKRSNNKGGGKKGGKGRGRGGKGRGRGGGPGQGRGAGAGGGGAQPGRVVHRAGPPQVRLFYLKQHLVLKCFNYLDDASRKNVFRVMGWPLDNYERRKEMMRKQQEERKRRMKEAEEKKKKEDGDTSENNDNSKDSASTTPKWAPYGEGEADGKSEGATSGTAKEQEGKVDPMKAEDPKDLLKALTLSVGEAWEDKNEDKNYGEAKVECEAPGARSNESEAAKEEDKAKTSEEEVQGGDVAGENNAEGDKEAQGEDAKDSEKGETGDEAKTDNNEAPAPEEKEILPPLFARTDPDTLLARLNTRRLFQRVLHFKRRQRKKLDADTINLLLENNNGDAEGKVESIREMYENELKEKMTANRVWRKDMTIQEMADLEWDELLELAELRNEGKELPVEPIPTQHELLLFSPCPRAVAVLASYPRSGNSLMRTLYEHTTLRVTGSDMQGGLAKHDLVGEMAVGTNMVQFVKTHFPERQGTPPFRASRVVLLVRNPFDAIDSFYNLMMTGTHTTTVTDEVREKTAKIWEEYVLKELRVWKGFHNFWINQDVPLLLIRYEDLIRQPDKVMARVIQFVLEIQRMGSFFTERIDRCIREQAEIERMGSYKPRSGGIGKSMSKYSPELLKKLKEDKSLREVMVGLGYGELLTKPVEEWSDLEPLKDHGTEYLPSWAKTGNEKVVLLNRGHLARGKNEVTPWQKIKVELGITDSNCNCEKCRAIRNRGVGSNEQPSEGGGDGGDGGEQEAKTGEEEAKTGEEETKTGEEANAGEEAKAGE